jgi:hypothetical protein
MVERDREVDEGSHWLSTVEREWRGE